MRNHRIQFGIKPRRSGFYNVDAATFRIKELDEAAIHATASSIKERTQEIEALLK